MTDPFKDSLNPYDMLNRIDKLEAARGSSPQR
jgi:hypothetical protein